MKTIKKNIIFAFISGILVLSLPVVSSGTTIGNNQKNQSSVTGGESETKFSAYIVEILPEFTKTENWSIIEKVVTLYNQTPSKVKNIQSEDIAAFNIAVADLGKKLEVVNSIEALQWKSDLDKTAGAVRFIRNFDLNSFTPDNLEIPAIKGVHSIVSL